MRIAEWLDLLEEQDIDVSHIVLPEELTRDEEPDETIYFKEIRPCSILCTGVHPFSTVEVFGHWYYSRGRDREKGPHTSLPQWWLFTKDKDLAIRTAQTHIEQS